MSTIRLDHPPTPHDRQPADTASTALDALCDALRDLTHLIETIAYAVMLDEPIPYLLTDPAPHSRNKS